MASASVTMTINGKPYSEATFRNEIERAMLEAMIEGTKEKIASLVSPSEASQLTIDVQGTDMSRLSLSVKGPEEIVAKVQAALTE